MEMDVCVHTHTHTHNTHGMANSPDVITAYVLDASSKQSEVPLLSGDACAIVRVHVGVHTQAAQRPRGSFLFFAMPGVKRDDLPVAWRRECIITLAAGRQNMADAHTGLHGSMDRILYHDMNDRMVLHRIHGDGDDTALDVAIKMVDEYAGAIALRDELDRLRDAVAHQPPSWLASTDDLFEVIVGVNPTTAHRVDSPIKLSPFAAAASSSSTSSVEQAMVVGATGITVSVIKVASAVDITRIHSTPAKPTLVRLFVLPPTVQPNDAASFWTACESLNDPMALCMPPTFNHRDAAHAHAAVRLALYRGNTRRARVFTKVVPGGPTAAVRNSVAAIEVECAKLDLHASAFQIKDDDDDDQ